MFATVVENSPVSMQKFPEQYFSKFYAIDQKSPRFSNFEEVEKNVFFKNYKSEDFELE